MMQRRFTHAAPPIRSLESARRILLAKQFRPGLMPKGPAYRKTDMRFAIFHWIMVLIVLWRFVLPLDVRRSVKCLIALLFIAIAAFSTLATLFFGGLVSPELPHGVIVVKEALEAFLLFFTGLVFLREAVVFLTVLAGRSGERAHRAVQKDRRTALGLAAAGAALGGVALAGGIKVPEVRRRTAYVPDLPEALEGFEFVQLSDTHLSALLTRSWAQTLVERVNALKPKLILITGDLVDGRVERRREDIEPFGRFEAEMGVYGCDGNHEQYGEYERWETIFAQKGIRMLRNEHVVFDISGAKLVLAGVCDPMAARFGRELPDAAKAFNGAPEGADVLRILMAHQPKFFPRYRAAADFSLQLSGHTHGGQIFGMDKVVAVMNGNYVRGFYRTDPRKLPGKDALMYVHPGSGLWNGFAVRLGAPSEIALIRLERAPAEAAPRTA